jgi:hypothetical protein
MSTATAFALPLPARPKADAARFNAHLLNVTFEAVVDGGRRFAIGGGESIPEAIAAARAELPGGDWTLVRWSPLFGE